MKNGDVVFFQLAKPSSARKAAVMKFQGHGFGILLGHVPPFQKDPPANHIFRLLGTIGLLTFDDVGEFLGEEAGNQCVQKFQDKYYGKVTDPNAPAPEAEPALAEAPKPTEKTDAPQDVEPGRVPPLDLL